MNTKRIRVLIVDDEPLVSKALKRNLRCYAVNVEYVLSLQEGIERINTAIKEEHPYTLVFIDGFKWRGFEL